MQGQVFIVITLNESFKKYIEKKLDFFVRSVEAKWTTRDEYHIILSSLGYLSDDKMVEICSSLRGELEDEEAFDVKLDSLKWGPNDSSRKMLWLQGAPNEQLVELRNRIEQILTNSEKVVGVFSPHITLAKFRKKELIEAEKVIIPDDIKISILVPVKSVEIVEVIFKDGKKTFQALDSIEFK